jgi:uncharacterized protein DUF642
MSWFSKVVRTALAIALLSGVAAVPAHGAIVRVGHVKAAASRGTCPAWPGGSGILKDGDFSLAVNPGNIREAIPATTKFAPRWVALGPQTIDFYGNENPDWSAPNGVCNVDLDGTPGPGGIQTTFAAAPATSYTLTFEMSANATCGSTVKEVLLKASGGQSTTLTWNTANGNDAEHGVWDQESWRFVATKRHMKISFESEDPEGNCGALIAAVAVNVAAR